MSHEAPFPPLKNERLFLLTLAGMQFTHILDFMIMMPLGPQLIRLLHLSTQQFGLLLSSYTFGAAASSLLATTYVDRFDRRKLVLTLYVLFIVSTLFCGLAQDFSSLLIARVMAGAFGGILSSIVHTMIADVIPFGRRGQAMGTVMASFSMATVAGVPLGLFIASHVPVLGWRAPFFFIVLLSIVFFGIAYKFLPSMTFHLGRIKVGNIFEQIYAVAREPNHLTAFAFMGMMMMASFTVIPYMALYLTTNVGLPEEFLTLVYLCGGAATFFTSQLIGKLSDRHGKLAMFRALALAAFVPLLITTHLVPVAWPLVLINSTIFFILVPGRMIPGMAMVTAASTPQVRGTFMSLMSSVQMLAAGLASLLTGLIISRNDAGMIVNFNIIGYIAVVAGVLTIWIGQKMRVVSTAAVNPLPSE